EEPEPVVVEGGQLALFADLPPGRPALTGLRLPDLPAVSTPPLHTVRRLSYSALALFEQCSYKYYARYVVGMRERGHGTVPGATGLSATEIGDAAHRLLEGLDLSAPAVPDDLEQRVRGWYAAATLEEIERIGSFVAA